MIHSAYISVSGPAFATGMVCLIPKIRRSRSVASTSSVSVPGYATSFSAGRAGAAAIGWG
jgi:hypothetical protein